MKWIAIGLGAAVLALAAGAFALRGGEDSASDVVPVKASSPIAKPVAPVSTAKSKPPAPAQVKPCQRDGGEDSDPTGDDSSNARTACSSDGEGGSSGDEQAGDSSNDQAGDDQAGDDRSPED